MTSSNGSILPTLFGFDGLFAFVVPVGAVAGVVVVVASLLQLLVAAGVVVVLAGVVVVVTVVIPDTKLVPIPFAICFNNAALPVPCAPVINIRPLRGPASSKCVR